MKIIDELVVTNTIDEFIMAVEFEDHSVMKSYERRRISDDEVEVINHLNRDRYGQYYTTRHVYRISEGAVVNPEYNKEAFDPEQYAIGRVVALARSVAETIAEKGPHFGTLQTTLEHYIYTDREVPNVDVLISLYEQNYGPFTMPESDPYDNPHLLPTLGFH